MAVEIITREDLQNFRLQLLTDLKQLLKHQQISHSQWLKSSEVRKLLKISHSTLQNLRDSGKIPFAKMGGTIYYRYEEIEKLLNK